MFKLDLIKAINEWQIKGTGINKENIAKKIIEHSDEIDMKFKSLHSKCYRRIDLNNHYNFILGQEMQLPETYSSWSFDKEFVKKFNNGIPKNGYQGVIFEISNEYKEFEVIINLHELFNDPVFKTECESQKQNIINYDDGIGKYYDSESEIILKINSLKISQIWAYGGFSSKKDAFVKKYSDRLLNRKMKQLLDRKVKENKKLFGSKWITGKAKNRTIQFHIDTAKKLSSKI
jgi:hypothetical protein